MRVIFPFLLATVAFSVVAKAQPVPGETAEFRLHWGMVTVGTVGYQLNQTEPTTQGEDSVEIYSKLEARANAFMRGIYNFHTLIETWMPLDCSRSHRYSRNEVTDDVTHVAYFNWELQQVLYSRNEDVREPLSLEANAQDPFSIIHALRSGRIPRTPGEYKVWATDGRVVQKVTLVVHSSERIRTPAGRMNAIKVSADFKDLRAIFARPEGAWIHVWLSDDAHLFPVRLQSEAVIGSFTSSLVSYDVPGLDRLPASR